MSEIKNKKNKMDLKCLEVVCETADNNFAEKDNAISQDPRILRNLLALERATIPHVDYFRIIQGDLKPFMRKIVTTWMLEVSFYLAYVKNIFNPFLTD